MEFGGKKQRLDSGGEEQRLWEAQGGGCRYCVVELYKISLAISF